MTVPAPDQLEFISEGNGVLKEFSYPRRFLQKDEIVVAFRKDNADTIKGLNIDYTIAGSSWPNGGSVVFTVAPPVGVKVVRYRKTQAKQTVDLDNNQRNDAKAVELQLDRLTMALQDTDVLARSAVRTDNKEGYRLSPPVPEKLLGWDEQGKAIISSSKTVQELDEGIASAQKAAEEAVAAKDTTLEVIDEVSDDLTTVIEMRPEIQAVISDKANIGTVAGNIGNVNKVAVIDAAVSKVAAIDTDVSKVAVIDTDVSRVAAISLDVQTVAGDRVNINAVADNKTNIDTVAGSKTNIDAVAGNKLNIDAVAGNATNINVVSAHATEVDTVASNMARVVIVSDNMGKVVTISVIAAEVVEVADIKAAVQAVAAIGEDVQTVSRNIASVVNVAGNKTNIDIVALNIADIQDASQNMAAIKAAPDAATRSETAAGQSKEYCDEALGVFANMKGGAVGYALVKRSAADYDYEWLEITGLGDMTKAIFDPTGVNGDAFDMALMKEAPNAKVMTGDERTKLAGIAAGATANTGTVTSVAVAVPVGLAATGAITTSGTITISYASGYQGYTTAEANKLAGVAAGADKTPALAAVATTGEYGDLSGRPTIPAAQVRTDWNASSGMASIANKPATFPPSAHTHTPAQVGLGNVANKSEAQMVVSGAIADALEGKLPSNAQAADSARLGNKTAVQWQTEVDAKAVFGADHIVFTNAERTAGTVYQNTTGHDIVINIRGSAAGASSNLEIGNSPSTLKWAASVDGASTWANMSTIVPKGFYYRLNGGLKSGYQWMELR